METKPRTLLIDLETAPSLGYYFDLYKEGNIVATKQEWYLLSFAYKWLGETTKAFSLPDFKGYKPDSGNDLPLVKELHKLFDEADIIVAHNGDNFDIKKSNARFAFHKLPPPSPYRTVDTLKAVRQFAAFTSNRLDALARHLGYGHKVVHTGIHLWMGCMSGDPEAWRLMVKYNKHDVELLEKIYLHFLPWIKNHPNVGVYSTIKVCTRCGSTNIHRRGTQYNSTTAYQRLKCMTCKGWMREIKNTLETKPFVNA